MNNKEQNIIDEFKSAVNILSAWGAHVDHLLTTILLKELVDKGFVKIFPRFRLKDSRSYLFKALYRKREYNNPLVEIQDKVATRVVLLKSDEIKVATALICDYPHWKAEITKAPESEIEDQPKLFDYQSCHIVVKPISDFGTSELPIGAVTCEIQIRTLLQHAFAEVSHDSTYKGPYRNDAEILRHLAKSMALMEATDDYFCRIFGLMSDEKKQFSVLLKELIALYQGFFLDFDISTINYDLCDQVLELVVLKPIALQEMEAFMEKHKAELKRGLQPKNGLLFSQPVILLVAFYLFKDRFWLRESWPLNQESLKSVFKAFNYSWENF